MYPPQRGNMSIESGDRGPPSQAPEGRQCAICLNRKSLNKWDGHLTTQIKQRLNIRLKNRVKSNNPRVIRRGADTVYNIRQ